MILRDLHSRFIIWGAKVDDSFVTGGLAFVASSYSTSSVKLVNHHTEEYAATIDLPSELLRLNLPSALVKVNFTRI